MFGSLRGAKFRIRQWTRLRQGKLKVIAMGVFTRYLASEEKNRRAFSCNFAPDVRTFESLLETLQLVWARLGRERGASGVSHAGLLLFSNILTRHTLVGFEHLSSYQSFLAWLSFRPGLEALLITGKFVDDPRNAGIWKNRQTDWKLYDRTFSGSGLESKSIAQSRAFRKILSRLNDELMHPNPSFTYRDATQEDEGNDVLLEIQCFDTDADIHEAHLLAYLNLLDLVIGTSTSLVDALCGAASTAPAREEYATQQLVRATRLAARNCLAKKVMQELGLWKM